VALAGPIAAATPDPSTARETVARTIEQVLVVVRDTAAPTPKRVERIERIADENFDWDLMARLVLARNWSKLTPEQRRSSRASSADTCASPTASAWRPTPASRSRSATGAPSRTATPP